MDSLNPTSFIANKHLNISLTIHKRSQTVKIDS